MRIEIETGMMEEIPVEGAEEAPSGEVEMGEDGSPFSKRRCASSAPVT